MRFLHRRPSSVPTSGKSTPKTTNATNTPYNRSTEELPATDSSTSEKQSIDEGSVSWFAVFMGLVASLGGFMFGYESGQISGFLQESDFRQRFAEHGRDFSNARSGTIVALLCIGTLLGCLISAPLADRIGRRYTISSAALFYIIGVIIEITSSTKWYQFAIGRLVAGLGIGALSVTVPMYQSESVPKKIRGTIVTSYQLLITIGIWTAYMVNYGTSKDYVNSAQWRIPNGLSALWALILGGLILLFPESPRYAYRMGHEEQARKTMGRLANVDPHGPHINREIAEIEEKLAAERAGGDHGMMEVFTGPRMMYRTLLGMILQAGQQLTGGNYFFYYVITIFTATGLSNPYVTSIIIGSVNVGATILAIIFGDRIGRRKALMGGAAWMFVCFVIYAFVGHFMLKEGHGNTSTAGSLLIVFTCLFIAAFATTWGPLVWSVVGELYPARYRAWGIALATSANWGMNFLISFFSPFITGKIDYYYGLVFGVCCLALFFIVYFFMIESLGRSLEEIDTMYVLHVDPRKSASWTGDDLGRDGPIAGTDQMFLTSGGRNIKKVTEGGDAVRAQSVHLEGSSST
ncbi:MFS monosaccharide transporter-like protein [Pseudovirgaria hyperparasitica]|uniref:MFS monosaccharide transporter-like protein n=1 Tax=Pseudovirgaria hyperparasitica TaxID=470096 RepID=A0A6A6VX97_9PEZI|nr:MFS monosaccharide transporter-like protein [Pseudovirgaria hyperparasitica]KAF2753871.1 MFS monosaccharide transporter-like protein [Pseudovirgaria hyperparasitica]